MDNEPDEKPARLGQVARYEAIFAIFMAAITILGRDNAQLVLPEALYLMVALMGINLAAGLALRWAPETEALSTAFVLSNCGVVTALLAYSGGPDSNFWVLYLLPIYTAALLLAPSNLALVTGGALIFNGAYVLFWCEPGAGRGIELAVKGGVLVFAAAATGRLAQRDRALSGSLRARRAQLQELQTALERKRESSDYDARLAEVGLLTSGAAHDLGNSIGAVLGFTELLLNETGLSPQAREDARRIQNSARLSQEIARGMLSAARGRKAPLEPCSLAQVANSVLHIMEGALEGAGVSVRREFESEGWVRGAPVQLERVILNLVSNAVRAMPDGGELILTLAENDGQAVLTAEDTGPGIPEEMLPRLFKPFSTSRPEAGGTGLGLYLCREIAVQHGGMLAAENRERGGARFILRVPALATAGRDLAKVI